MNIKVISIDRFNVSANNPRLTCSQVIRNTRSCAEASNPSAMLSRSFGTKEPATWSEATSVIRA